jgi:hypothetical protein
MPTATAAASTSAVPSATAAFVQAAKFGGARIGYVFKRGAQGLGYYLDAKQQQQQQQQRRRQQEQQQQQQQQQSAAPPLAPVAAAEPAAPAAARTGKDTGKKAPKRVAEFDAQKEQALADAMFDEPEPPPPAGVGKKRKAA